MPYKNCLCREGWANPTTVLTIDLFIIIWIAPPVACLLNRQKRVPHCRPCSENRTFPEQPQFTSCIPVEPAAA